MKKFDNSQKFHETVVELAKKGFPQKRVHFISRDCGSLAELDYVVNELTNSNYRISEIMPMHSEFFASYTVIAFKPIKQKHKKKAKKSKGWF